MPPAIIGLNGSPHREGNTATLLGWVLDGCREAGAEVRAIHLVDFDIRYCQGCYHCLRTGACCQPDDVARLAGMILAADGLVVGSPVYAGQPSALLKTFTDRITLFALYMGTFDGQRAIGVATSGIAPTKGTARSAAKGFGRVCGVATAKTATLSGGFRALTAEEFPRTMRRARKLGHRFAMDTGKRGFTLMLWWINFLRRNFLKRLILKNPEQFAGVIENWRGKGWL